MKLLIFTLLALGILYLLLLIPDGDGPEPVRAGEKPFVWNQDGTWEKLESRFLSAGAEPPSRIDSGLVSGFSSLEAVISRIESSSLLPDDPVFDSLETAFFSLAPLIAIRQDQLNRYLSAYTRIRKCVKYQSRSWDLTTPVARITLYRIFYGIRSSVEEVLLQSDSLSFAPRFEVEPCPSVCPEGMVGGVPVRSGDLLVSRGGFEVSALISRGNDFPGVFSHVALVHVDPETKKVSLIEAHIEKGVAVTDADGYMRDKKLRFIVLRLRPDLPEMARNPLLPHEAAELGLSDAGNRHIPYDFRMNFSDSAALFCSEVGSYAYRKKGIHLWKAISSISSQGIVNWLNSFGVENFVTQMPSDLEYDPQLVLVTEWRDPETLRQDHVYNAVMDVLIEKADSGEEISYNRWLLPPVRVFKGYCWVMNQFGRVERIPEGMSAIRALKNEWFVSRFQHLKEKTEKRVIGFRQQNGYFPPMWKLIALAREADSDRE